MFTNRSKLAATASQTTDLTDQGIDRARALAMDALDQLQAAIDKAENRGVPLIRRVANGADDVAQRGIAAVRQGGQQARKYALQSAGQATAYARRNPYKTALLAAVAVASLAAVAGALTKRSTR